MDKSNLIFLMIVFSLLSCNSNFTPKPRAYYKIDLPTRRYQIFNENGFPYEFEYPVYASISKEYDSTGNNPFWINVNFDNFNGRIYLSYKSIKGHSVYKVKTENGYRDSLIKNNFDALREEAYKLTYKHTVKASGIVDSMFITNNGSSGVYFYVAGDAATSRQFYISDTATHFIRGALYFDVAPNSDSLTIVSDFLDADMKHLINTFRWKKNEIK
jgi:gliding motility-associated lipoprotein GldD